MLHRTSWLKKGLPLPSLESMPGMLCTQRAAIAVTCTWTPTHPHLSLPAYPHVLLLLSAAGGAGGWCSRLLLLVLLQLLPLLLLCSGHGQPGYKADVNA